MKTNKNIYIAKPNTWFKSGSEAELIEYYQYGMGLFEGVFVIDDEKWLKVKEQWKNKKVGDEVIDREVCDLDEFKIIKNK